MTTDSALAYAHRLKADAIYILSARYGLLDLEQEIEPYEKTLKAMSRVDAARWADGVVEQLRARADLMNDRFILLAGTDYRSRLVSHLAHFEVPLNHLRIGEQLKFLTSALI